MLRHLNESFPQGSCPASPEWCLSKWALPLSFRNKVSERTLNNLVGICYLCSRWTLLPKTSFWTGAHLDSAAFVNKPLDVMMIAAGFSIALFVGASIAGRISGRDSPWARSSSKASSIRARARETIGCEQMELISGLLAGSFLIMLWMSATNGSLRSARPSTGVRSSSRSKCHSSPLDKRIRWQQLNIWDRHTERGQRYW